jgi:hypothetical protein
LQRRAGPRSGLHEYWCETMGASTLELAIGCGHPLEHGKHAKACLDIRSGQ